MNRTKNNNTTRDSPMNPFGAARTNFRKRIVTKYSNNPTSNTPSMVSKYCILTTNDTNTITTTTTTTRYRIVLVRIGILLAVLIFIGLTLLQINLFDTIVANTTKIHHTDNNSIDDEVKRSSVSTIRRTKVTIFYNVYIPPVHDTAGITNARIVIQEQIYQISRSDLFILFDDPIPSTKRRSTKLNNNYTTYDKNDNDDDDDDDIVVLYYNTIGNNISLVPSEINSWCTKAHPKLHCIHLEHYIDGTDESVTLQSIYDYCTIDNESSSPDRTLQQQHPFPYFRRRQQQQQQQKSTTSTTTKERVVYLHSKGSYHNNKANNIWRRALTAAALHIDCIDPPSAPASSSSSSKEFCSVCGLQFYTLFTMFYPGNMWTASCNYIQQLVPPRTPMSTDTTTTSTISSTNNTTDTNWFQYQMDQVMKHALVERARGRIETTLLRDRIDYYGLDRYAMEHWIGSNPLLLQPCDVDPIGSFHELFSKKRSKFYKNITIQQISNIRYTNRYRILKKKYRSIYRRQQDPTRNTTSTINNSNNDEMDMNDDDDNYNIDDDTNAVDEYGFRFAYGPRHTGFVVGNAEPANTNIVHNATIRYREYYFLPGHIMKWSILYPSLFQQQQQQLSTSITTTPNNNVVQQQQYKIISNSWIWDWFPDGSYWRDAIQQHGIMNVIREVNRNYTFHVGIPDHQLHTVNSSFHEPKYSRTTTTTTTTTGTQSIQSITSYRRLSETKLESKSHYVNLTLDTDSVTDYVIFYHITIPLSLSSTTDITDEMDVVTKQLYIIATSDVAIHALQHHQRLVLFYTITVSSPYDTNITNEIRRLVGDFCSRYSTFVSCRLLNLFYNDYEGETLRQLYQYCTANRGNTFQGSTIKDDTIVIYVHNQGPIQLRQTESRTKLRNFILHSTMAITDYKCLRNLWQEQNNDSTVSSCNVCGLLFYTFWTFLFLGNMFTSRCSYVQQLLSPTKYEYQMNTNVVGTILLAKLRKQIMTSILPTIDRRPDLLGLDRYAIDHWIGSHPSIVPCDVSDNNQTYSYWSQLTPPIRNDSIIQLLIERIQQKEDDTITKNNILQNNPFRESDLPYKRTAPTFICSMNETLIMETTGALNDSLRFREYNYLAGYFLKWDGLYQTFPPPTSWIWKWFPDGDTWQRAIQVYGSNAFDTIISKYYTKNNIK